MRSKIQEMSLTNSENFNFQEFGISSLNKPTYWEILCLPNLNSCLCPNGNPVTNSQCLDSNQIQCNSCNIFYHLQDNSCIENSCQCKNGQAVSNQECFEDGWNYCSSCAEGYELTLVSLDSQRTYGVGNCIRVFLLTT